jgi:hypothetical protein
VRYLQLERNIVLLKAQQQQKGIKAKYTTVYDSDDFTKLEVS